MSDFSPDADRPTPDASPSGLTTPLAPEASASDGFDQSEQNRSKETPAVPAEVVEPAVVEAPPELIGAPEARDADTATPEDAQRAAERPVDPESPERRELEASPSSRCLNCQAELPGAYCPACGQKDQPLRQPVHRYMVEALSEYLGLDGRVWPTLGALLFRPGRLTKAYVLGRRQQYVRPLRIYITASLFFFFLLALIDPIGKLRNNVDSPSSADSTMTAAAYLVSLDQAIEEEEDDIARQRAVVDSLRGLILLSNGQDSIATASSGMVSVESLQSDVEDEEDELAAMSSSTFDRRLQTQKAMVASMNPDSLVRPSDVQQAAEIIVPRETNIRLGPDWMVGSESVRRLKNARTSQQQQDAGWAFGREAIGRLPTVVFLLLPFFALFMKLLYARRGWYYAEHLVFALHVHAFAFVVFSVYAVMIWASGGAAAVSLIGSILLLAIPVYFLVAQKRVYAQGWVKTLVKAYLLSWLYGFALFGGAILAVVLAAVVG
ncbi:DUF3667 domain-containing protein [Rubricoccus marinus]|uniref:DUF3667 domain-containing protein n=1 Tax=Rubricoccus marinus TaxID=716817 RepID=A0A259TZB5_9BACT|nr:DUF3667 domain-containing protein [Rubricoccus marinus]OZC03061.1 hypothetical protein BSZ36_08810 [Rubricoccus marinus]